MNLWHYTGGWLLSPLPVQYKDYTNGKTWKRINDSLKAKGAFWHEVFSEEIPVLDCPGFFQASASGFTGSGFLLR